MLLWRCAASFDGIQTQGKMLGRPILEATEGAIVQLAEALDRDAAALRAQASPPEEGEARRLLATRMDVAAIIARMTISKIEAASGRP